MIRLKTEKEIEIMKEGGRRLREAVKRLMPKIKSGQTTKQIDKEAEKLIREYGGEPAFKRVPGYHWSTCITINEQVVHTPPSNRALKEGDLSTLDIGMYYQGFNTDFAWTVRAGEKKDDRKEHFLNVGQTALNKAIRQAKVGNRLGHISQAIEKEIYHNGFFVLKELTGHGIGQKLHEDPSVPGFLDRPLKKTPLIQEGLTIAIEVIYSQSTERICYEKERRWSVVTADGSLAACFEHTIVVTKNGPLILT